MKLWLATHAYDYEPDSVIGIFSTETKAMQACEDTHWSKEPLKWENGIASFHGQRFDVSSYELDETQFS